MSADRSLYIEVSPAPEPLKGYEAKIVGMRGIHGGGPTPGAAIRAAAAAYESFTSSLIALDADLANGESAIKDGSESRAGCGGVRDG